VLDEVNQEESEQNDVKRCSRRLIPEVKRRISKRVTSTAEVPCPVW